MPVSLRWRTAALTLVALLLGVATAQPLQPAIPAKAADPNQINHVIVVYQENWSFDSLYPYFSGANGIANPGAAAIQVDKTGKPYTTLPQPLNSGKPDPRFPADLANGPFDALKYVAANEKTGDVVHRYYTEQAQIDGGKMDKFVAFTDAAGLAMSYMDATNMPEGKLAQQYVMADNFFHEAFGGSFLNHIFLICSCAPTWPNAPANKSLDLRR